MASLRNPRPYLHMADGGLVPQIAGSLRGWITGANNPTRQESNILRSPAPAAPAPPPAPMAAGGDPSRVTAENPAGLRFAHGGVVHGPGTGVSDSIPAKLSHGEFVVPADTTAKVGAHNLQAMVDKTHTPVQGLRGGYANGGMPGVDASEFQFKPTPGGSAVPGMSAAEGVAAPQVSTLQAPTNPNVGASGSPEAQAFRAQPTAPPAAASTPTAPPAPAPSLRAGAAAQGSRLGAAAYSAGRLGGALAKNIAPVAGIGGAAQSFDDQGTGYRDHFADSVGADSPLGSVGADTLRTLGNVGDAATFGLAGKVGRGIASAVGGGSFSDGFSSPSDRDAFLASKSPQGATPAPSTSGAGPSPSPDTTFPEGTNGLRRNGNSFSGQDIGFSGNASPGGNEDYVATPGVSSADRIAQMQRDGAQQTELSLRRQQSDDSRNGVASSPGGVFIDDGGRAKQDRQDFFDMANAHTADSRTPSLRGGGSRGAPPAPSAASGVADRIAQRDVANARNQSDLRDHLLQANTLRRGQDLTAQTAADEHNVQRTGQQTTLRGHQLTAQAALAERQRQQQNFERTTGTAEAQQNFTDGQAAQKNRTEQIASMLPPGADGKLDMGTAARYTAGLVRTVADRTAALERQVQLHPDDKAAQSALAGYKARGQAMLSQTDVAKHVAGMQAADLASATGTNGLTPWGTTAVASTAPIKSLTRLPNGDYRSDRGDVIPGRHIDKAGSFLGFGGRKTNDYDILKTN